MKKTENPYASLLDKFSKQYSKVSRSRIKNVIVILCAILVKETVNLNKLKNQLGCITGKESTQADSHYKRLTRFFVDPFNRYQLWKVLLQAIWQLLIQHLDQRRGGKYLILDATCWQFGQVKIQLLVLSILYQGVSIAIFWINLGKKGHSSFLERKRLIQMASLLYNLEGMTLLADREYIGREWFSYLKGKGIDFVIRLPVEDYKHEISQAKYAYSYLIKKARAGKTIAQWVDIQGHRYQFIALKNEQATDKKEELVLLLTSLAVDKKRVVALYGLRWQIECMFKHLKTNGFHLEDLSLMQSQKVRLMVCLIIASYVLCVCEGIKNMSKIRHRTLDNGEKHSYESIFGKGYGMLANKFQTIVLFLAFLLGNVGKPIRCLKPT